MAQHHGSARGDRGGRPLRLEDDTVGALETHRLRGHHAAPVGRAREREGHRFVAPRVVAAGRSAVAGTELGAQHDRTIRCRVRAQLRDPLRRFPVLHPGVVQAGRDEERGVSRVAHIVVRRIGLHPCVRVGLARVAPLLPLGDGERDGRVEHRGDDVDERHLGDDGGEQVRALIGDRAHEQAAGAPTSRHQPAGRRVLGRDQRFRARDEVVEGVVLVLEASVLVPRASELAATAYVRDRIREAPVEQ